MEPVMVGLGKGDSSIYARSRNMTLNNEDALLPRTTSAQILSVWRLKLLYSTKKKVYEHLQQNSRSRARTLFSHDCMFSGSDPIH